MLKATLSLLVCVFVAAAQGLTVTSAASSTAGVAPESLASVFGAGLAPQSDSAHSVPWPTELDGVSITVTDSRQVSRAAGLIFISPAQINFEIPGDTAAGPATVAVMNSAGTQSTTLQVQPAAPALFAINNLGVAAATAIREVIPTHIQTPVPVFRCVDTPGSCRLAPLDVGVDAPVYLAFFGTGIRNRSSLDNVVVTIGTTAVTPLYAGPQPQYPGLDQVNAPLPISLRGAGQVPVTVTVDGITSNPVYIQIQ